MKAKTYLLFSIVIFLTACSSVENIAYLQKLSSKSTDEFSNHIYEVKIKPKDLLSIIVTSTEPEASRIYNLISPTPQSPTMEGGTMQSRPALQNYLVDNEGFINFPVFGKILVKDMTKKDLESYLLKKLEPAFSNELPIVTIRIVNYSVNVLGELNAPGKYLTNNENITIFEALALASDMTIYGKRENVKVLREDAEGNKTFYTLNLNDRDIINSPAYFLEQNDVVYVEPNQSRSNASKYGAAESFRISSISVLISLLTMAVTIYSVTR